MTDNQGLAPRDNLQDLREEALAQGNRPVTWNDLQDLRRGLQAYVDVKIDILEKRFDAVDERFDKLDERFDKLEAMLESVIGTFV